MASEAAAVSGSAGAPSTLPGKARQKREAILAAAAKLFRDGGYNATTLRQIAMVTHIEAGSVYYHFESKEAILDEVLRIGLRHVFEAVRRAREESRRAQGGFRRTFTLMIGAHLSSVLNDSDFTSANIRNYSRLPQDLRALHRPLRRAYAALWDETLEEARARGEIRAGLKVEPLRQFVLSAMNWMVEWHQKDRPAAEVLSERLARLLLDGMLARGAGPPGPPRPAGAEIAVLVEGDGSKASRTRAQLLSAAARVLREHGYRATTMRDIAEAAGIKAGSIYYHFSSKDEIVVEVLDIGLRHLLRGVAEIASAHPFSDHRARIAAALRVHLEHLFCLSDFTSANIRIYGQLPRHIRARHRPLRHAYATLWDGFLGDAQAAGVLCPDIAPTPLRQNMLGALNWTVEWFDPQRQGRGCYALPELVSMAETVLLDGLAQPTLAAGRPPAPRRQAVPQVNPPLANPLANPSGDPPSRSG